MNRFPRVSRVRRILAACLLAALLVAGQAMATDRYVATNGVAPNDGSTWAAAYTNLQTALNAAANGDTIYLAGQLFPLTNQLTWVNKTNVTIRGGYAATNAADQPGPYDSRRWPTILARIGATDFATDVRIMSITNVADGLLERVAFTGGRVSASLKGGGLYILKSTNLVISACSITNNAVASWGNGWPYGGGIYSESSFITVSNCLIRGNSVNVKGTDRSFGGGIYIKNGTMLLQNSILANNLALDDGDDQIRHYGGGLYNEGTCVLRNCLVVGNVVGNVGYQSASSAGIHAYGNTRLENCTVTDNAGVGIFQESGTVTVTNSVVWGNLDDVYGTVTLGWSDIEDGDQNGTRGNISANPRFEYGYYLATDSPCVDAGTNTADAWGLTNATTRADGSNDSARVDLGYHYATGMDMTYADVYVATNGTNTSSGTSWAEAYRTITKALAVAQDGTRIHLASGNYTNGLETFPLTLTSLNGLQLLGTNRTTTVINAAGATQRVMTVNNCAGLTVSEITFTGGYLTTNYPNLYGGGVYLSGCGGVVMSGCLISSNTLYTASANVNVLGGGLYSISSSVTLSNCTVRNNRITTSSGDAYFTLGGGLYLWGGSMKALDSIITNNVTSGTRSGVARVSGGGVYGDKGSWLLRNCLVGGNAVVAPSGSGGGLSQFGYYSVIRIENCTVANNSGQGLYTEGNSAWQAVTNSIFWGNGDDLVGTMVLAYSDVQTADSFWTNGVNGNIMADPQFVNTNAADYRLARYSPCADSGIILSWMTGAVDLDGNRRIIGGIVDMGAYESPIPFSAILIQVQ